MTPSSTELLFISSEMVRLSLLPAVWLIEHCLLHNCPIITRCCLFTTFLPVYETALMSVQCHSLMKSWSCLCFIIFSFRRPVCRSATVATTNSWLSSSLSSEITLLAKWDINRNAHMLLCTTALNWWHKPLASIAKYTKTCNEGSINGLLSCVWFGCVRYIQSDNDQHWRVQKKGTVALCSWPISSTDPVRLKRRGCHWTFPKCHSKCFVISASLLWNAVTDGRFYL